MKKLTPEQSKKVFWLIAAFLLGYAMAPNGTVETKTVTIDNTAPYKQVIEKDNEVFVKVGTAFGYSADLLNAISKLDVPAMEKASDNLGKSQQEIQVKLDERKAMVEALK